MPSPHKCQECDPESQLNKGIPSSLPGLGGIPCMIEALRPQPHEQLKWEIVELTMDSTATPQKETQHSKRFVFIRGCFQGTDYSLEQAGGF